MKQPEYQWADLAAPFPPKWCNQCGSLVFDTDRHTSWHAALARLLGLENDE